MSFNGTEGKRIPSDTAKRWEEKWKEANPGAIEAIFFGKDKLREFLDEPGCMGLRIYFAINDDGDHRLVLYGASADENNMLPSAEGKDGGSGPLDDGSPCPPSCPGNG